MESNKLREQLHEIWIKHSGVTVDSQPVEETLDLIRKAKIAELKWLKTNSAGWGNGKKVMSYEILKEDIDNRIKTLTQEEK